MSSGILKNLAEKKGTTVSAIKSAIMKSAAGSYRIFLKEHGLVKGNSKIYRTYLKFALPFVWQYVKETGDIPSPEAVYAHVMENTQAVNALNAALATI